MKKIQVNLDEIEGFPEDEEKAEELMILTRELNKILNPKIPVVAFEEFFIALLEKEEITINQILKSLIILILVNKARSEGIISEDENEEDLKKSLIH